MTEASVRFDVRYGSLEVVAGQSRHFRFGKHEFVDEVCAATASGDIDRMLAALQLDTNAVERSFLLSSIFEHYYPLRTEPTARARLYEVAGLFVRELPLLLRGLIEDKFLCDQHLRPELVKRAAKHGLPVPPEKSLSETEVPCPFPFGNYELVLREDGLFNEARLLLDVLDAAGWASARSRQLAEKRIARAGAKASLGALE